MSMPTAVVASLAFTFLCGMFVGYAVGLMHAVWQVRKEGQGMNIRRTLASLAALPREE